MTHHYCTLFDHRYLYKGLALHQSLLEVSNDFVLWVLCMDNLAYEVVSTLELRGVRAVAHEEFTNDTLRRLRTERTPQEYCWTCTSALLLFLLDGHPEIERLTYLDADIYFFADPRDVLARYSDCPILLTPHNYAAAYDRSSTSGVYCVQFISFRRDELGMTALRWWSDRCSDWCFARFEDGRFGDQKYLDDWPTRFAGVGVITDIGVGVAPWNVSRYDVRRVGDGVAVNGQPVVFYHFHEFGVFAGGRYVATLSDYALGPAVIEHIYQPYSRAISTAVARVLRICDDPRLAPPSRRPWTIFNARARRKARWIWSGRQPRRVR